MGADSNFTSREEATEISSDIAKKLSERYTDTFPNQITPSEADTCESLYIELITHISKPHVTVPLELPLADIAKAYFFFKSFGSHSPHFIEGFFQVDSTKKNCTDHLIFTEYCSKPELSGKRISFTNNKGEERLEYDQVLYSNDEFLKVTKKLGIPVSKQPSTDIQNPPLKSIEESLESLHAQLESMKLENLTLKETIQELKEDPKTISKQSQAIIALSKALIGGFSSSNQGTIDAIKCELEKKVPEFHISDNSWRAYLGFTSKNKKSSKPKNKIS